MQQQRLERAIRDDPRLAVLIQQFNRAVEQQNRRDTETLASLMRVLRNPRGADAEQFIELLRGLIAQELETASCIK